MEDEDRFVRITLRIPRELHAKLGIAARAESHSMNAEIVRRLSRSFEDYWEIFGPGTIADESKRLAYVGQEIASLRSMISATERERDVWNSRLKDEKKDEQATHFEEQAKRFMALSVEAAEERIRFMKQSILHLQRELAASRAPKTTKNTDP